MSIHFASWYPSFPNFLIERVFNSFSISSAMVWSCRSLIPVQITKYLVIDVSLLISSIIIFCAFLLSAVFAHATAIPFESIVLTPPKRLTPWADSYNRIFRWFRPAHQNNKVGQSDWTNNRLAQIKLILMMTNLPNVQYSPILLNIGQPVLNSMHRLHLRIVPLST